ncbi:MAG: protein-L-isoaspartate O-methyltransferase [Candidatus Moranbacteria bacterium]|nr:protein-L-isoaspartate O-methyltransferase [Candidatus Moranbacteria bacterium]
MSRLVNNLMHHGYLRSDAVIDAFWGISRIEFIPEYLSSESEADVPLPIGCGQTISQPRTVALMLELLQPKESQIILDVGSGSGWTSALLAYIVGKKGKIIAIERLHEIFEFGKKNIDKFGYVSDGTVECYEGDGYLGDEAHAPYDRILVSAMVDEIPEALKRQLKVGGIMVIPVHNDIWYIEKRGEDNFYKEEFPGFSFVPLVQTS